MNIILRVRGFISRFIKRFNLPIITLLKFGAYFLLFHYVAGIDGFAEGLRINSLPVQVILAVLSTLLPNRCGVFLAIVLMLANMWQLTVVGTGVAAVLFLFVYIMTSRMFPDQVYLLALVPLCLHYKLYIVLPVVAGMYIGVIALIPMIFGVIMAILLGLLPDFMTLTMPEKIDAVPQMLSNIFKYTFNQVLHNDMLIFLMILFTVVVVLIYLLRKIEINFGNYIALLAGVALGVICLLMGKISFDIPDTGSSILGHAVITFLILAFFEFMRTALNYEYAQYLSFEDDEYEYHVRVIPKIDLAGRKKKQPEESLPEPETPQDQISVDTGAAAQEGTKRIQRPEPQAPVQTPDPAQDATRVVPNQPAQPETPADSAPADATIRVPEAQPETPKEPEQAADSMESFFEEE